MEEKYYYIWKIKDLPTYDEKVMYRSKCRVSLLLKVDELNKANTNDTIYYRID